MQASEEVETRMRVQISIDASHQPFCAPCNRPAAMQAAARVCIFMWTRASSRPDSLPTKTPVSPAQPADGHPLVLSDSLYSVLTGQHY